MVASTDFRLHPGAARSLSTAMSFLRQVRHSFSLSFQNYIFRYSYFHHHHHSHYHNHYHSQYTVVYITCRPLQADSSKGGPFNRLILQTESGAAWQSDDEIDEPRRISATVGRSGNPISPLSLSLPLPEPSDQSRSDQITSIDEQMDGTTRMASTTAETSLPPTVIEPCNREKRPRDDSFSGVIVETRSLLATVKDNGQRKVSTQPQPILGPEIHLLQRERNFDSSAQNCELRKLLAFIPSFPTYAPQLESEEEHCARDLTMDWEE